MSEPAKPMGPSIEELKRPLPGMAPRAAERAMVAAPRPAPLPLREMETIERELGVRRRRIASSPGALAGPPMIPSEDTLDRLMDVWRFDQPQSTWAREARD